MELSERIARRLETTTSGGLVVDESALNPAVHLPEPVGRGSVMEQILDALDPVFDGECPDDLAVCGPRGSGKSAILTALFAQLNESLGRSDNSIWTSTRGSGDATAQFAYVDARRADSEFQYYHAILDTVSHNPVPRRGVGTDELRERLADVVAEHSSAIVVAVDHLSETDDGVADVRSLLEPVAAGTALVIVGEEPRDDWDGRTVEVPAYRSHALVDLLTERGSYGLTNGALAHDDARRIADWADGDAHDALAALFGAAISADRDGADRIRERDVDVGIDAVPDNCAQIGQVLALPENRRTVLSELLRVDGHERPISDAAEAVGERTDLSPSTVQRYLYELAEVGLLSRKAIEGDCGNGRTPTRVVPQFPTLVFERLEQRSRL
ncbi:Cdc6-related protein, AAA superfamily ATPase [Natronoarchaeum philippinense]|uniref:Cdc6-related protein, AAA superfamily ATPase n=1 Tax=Natronoarchaeum philippinense TaxID=558529 RepID=A0A285N5P9_NATPI|nr:AAA family ATPase [Natronoarchaeum philippinense]SNZ03326.1 Cdc6-related protein, AAA superfamily ATPase [Natronoarchaeum philippinense]